MDSITVGILRATVKRIFAADAVGNRTASPLSRGQHAASAPRITRMLTIGAHHIAGYSRAERIEEKVEQNGWY